MKKAKLMLGDNIQSLKKLPDNSIDSVVSDPPYGLSFMGSGSTGIAALLNDFRFVGMEMDEDYFKIAEARINNYEDYKKFLKK
jgi:DNA modification methylase